MKDIIPKENRIRGVASISALEKANPDFHGDQNVDYYIQKLLSQQQKSFSSNRQEKLRQSLNEELIVFDHLKKTSWREICEQAEKPKSANRSLPARPKSKMEATRRMQPVS
jgi:hypothetical protein